MTFRQLYCNSKESSTIEVNTRWLKLRNYDAYQRNIDENVHYKKINPDFQNYFEIKSTSSICTQ